MSSKTECVEVVSENFDKKKQGHTYMQWLVAILAATTLLSYGLQGGWTSPMTKVLQAVDSPAGRPLTNIEISWVASTMPVAAMFGVPLYAYIADTFGRKWGVIAMTVPQMICWIIKMVSSHPTALITARVFAGLPAGGCFNLIPMYIKEISQDDIRGSLVSFTMMFQNLGMMAMFAMGAYIGYYTVLWIALCVSVVTLVFIIILAPESPAFLVKKGRIEDATKIVASLRGLDKDDGVVQNEITTMTNEEAHYNSVEKISFTSIFRNKAWRRGFILGIFLLTALDLNGYFTIQAYALTVMTEAGVTVNPELQTLSIPALMILGSLVSMSCVEKLGRKPLLAGAFIVSTLAMACLASTSFMQKCGISPPSWLPVVAIIVTVFAYAAGILPMTYVILSEIFNFQVRAKLIGCIVAYGWFISFVQLMMYGPVSNYFGIHTIFYIFAGVNLFGALVVIVLLPETKGKTVEEIEKLLLRIRACF